LTAQAIHGHQAFLAGAHAAVQAATLTITGVAQASDAMGGQSGGDGFPFQRLQRLAVIGEKHRATGALDQGVSKTRRHGGKLS